MAGIALFVFQQGSRNALNNQRQEAKFKKYYQPLFKLRLPHLDTVHRVLCRLADEPLERLKQGLEKTLLEKKVLHPDRLLQRYFNGPEHDLSTAPAGQNDLRSPVAGDDGLSPLWSPPTCDA
ncbi:MAG: hypothetical protein ACFCVA_14400 [Gammaproteobacteria bacterium]